MSKYIHNLVNKMTPREKAYFKNSNFSEGEKKNYMKLYDIVVQYPTYDKEIVNREISSITMNKHLSSEYKYLEEKLLTSLVDYHYNGSVRNKLVKLTLFINILIEKNLKNKALKILSRAKKMAYEHELFTPILNLIEQEEEILFQQGAIGFKKKLDDLNKEQIRISELSQNFRQLRFAREEIKEFWFDEGFLDISDTRHTALNKIIDIPKALSQRAQLHWIYTSGMAHFIQQNHKKAAEIFFDAYNFIEKNNRIFNTIESLVMLSNYLYNCALTKNETMFDKGIKIIKSLEHNDNDATYSHYVFHCRTLEYLYQQKSYQQNTEYEIEVYSFLDENLNSFQDTQYNYLFFLIIRSKVLNSRFEECIELLHGWEKNGIIEYYNFHFRMIKLITYYELSYHQLLESQLNTTGKYLYRINKQNKISDSFFKFFRSFLKNKSLEIKHLEKLRLELLAIYSQNKDRKNYKYFNYTYWLDQKISAKHSTN